MKIRFNHSQTSSIQVKQNSYVCCTGIGGECAGELFLKLFLFKSILK
jgi:hypothetical protein